MITITMTSMAFKQLDTGHGLPHTRRVNDTNGNFGHIMCMGFGGSSGIAYSLRIRLLVRESVVVVVATKSNSGPPIEERGE